jgi:hypothetical protein
MIDRSDAAVARGLRRAMRAVAREAGRPSAYARTPQGRLAALRQRRRMMNEGRRFCNDYQRTVVSQELRHLQEERHA